MSFFTSVLISTHTHTHTHTHAHARTHTHGIAGDGPSVRDSDFALRKVTGITTRFFPPPESDCSILSDRVSYKIFFLRKVIYSSHVFTKLMFLS